MDKVSLIASLDKLDIWLIFFGVLVAIGVVGESVVGFLHWRQSGELQRLQTAENISLQAEVWSAKAEFEKYKAPRQLSEVQQAKIASKLKSIGSPPFAMSVIPGDPEAIALERVVANTLKMAGWHWMDWAPPRGPLSVILSTPGEPNVGQVGTVGVQIILAPDNAPVLWPAAHALVDVLNTEGIVADAIAIDQPSIQNKNAVNILVGKKPQ